MPANRHNQGANLSFADGHVEPWKWRAPKVFRQRIPPVLPAEMPDFDRLRLAIRKTGIEETLTLLSFVFSQFLI